MKTEQMRKEFEEWFLTTPCIFHANLTCDDKGVYTTRFAQDMWYAWQCASARLSDEIDALRAMVAARDIEIGQAGIKNGVNDVVISVREQRIKILQDEVVRLGGERISFGGDEV